MINCNYDTTGVIFTFNLTDLQLGIFKRVLEFVELKACRLNQLFHT